MINKRKKTYSYGNFEEESFSEKINSSKRLYIIMLLTMTTAFALTLLLSSKIINIFALIAFLAMLYLTKLNMFFIINFAAIFLRFILEEHDWFNQIAFYSMLQVHSFCVFDIAISFIFIQQISLAAYRALKLPLSEQTQQSINSPLYEISITIIIIVAHITILSIK